MFEDGVVEGASDGGGGTNEAAGVAVGGLVEEPMVNETDGLEVEGGGVGLGGEVVVVVVVGIVRPPRENGEPGAAEEDGPVLKEGVNLLVREKGGAEAVVMATLGTEIEEA